MAQKCIVESEKDSRWIAYENNNEVSALIIFL
jgi:hypothetical protein